MLLRATLYPFAVCHAEQDIIACESICMVSDCLRQDKCLGINNKLYPCTNRARSCQLGEENISGIKFFFIPAADTKQLTPKQEVLLRKSSTLPGTRSHHTFILQASGQLLKVGSLWCCRYPCPWSPSSSGKIQLCPGKYVEAVCDQAWYIVNNVVDKDDTRKDF